MRASAFSDVGDVGCRQFGPRQQEAREARATRWAAATGRGAWKDCGPRSPPNRSRAGVTVQDLLDKTNGTKKLMQTLRRASRSAGRGGWIRRPARCGWRIGGKVVRQWRFYVLAATDNRTPIDPQRLQVRLREWEKRTFSATGYEHRRVTRCNRRSRPGPQAGRVRRAEGRVNQVLQTIRPIQLSKNKNRRGRAGACRACAMRSKSG
jgi:hypothetical protein